MSSKTVLSTSNLCIGYPTKNEVLRIASDLNLKLDEEKLIALIGANGIGKSTLLRTITGIKVQFLEKRFEQPTHHNIGFGGPVKTNKFGVNRAIAFQQLECV